MATQEQLKTAVATQTKEPPKTLEQLIRSSEKQLGMALPKHMSPERLVRIALTCMRVTPKLALCTPQSFLGALFTSAQVGLEPVSGLAYLIPFRNNRKNCMEVQFVIGYQGYKELFYRHESSMTLDMQTVYENDAFDFEYGTSSFLKHKPAMGERGKVVGYYAVARLKGGASVFRFMTPKEIEAHGEKHSKSYNDDSSPWVSDFSAMAMKTVIRQLAKLLPLSAELQTAISSDETSRSYREDVKDAMEMPDETDWGKDANETTAADKQETKVKQPGSFEDFQSEQARKGK